MNEFTKGPWARDRYGHVIDRMGIDVRFRSLTICCSGSGVKEAEANTTLIAAAPELLAALQTIVRLSDENTAAIVTPAVEAARAAIKKATGDD